MLFNSLEFGLFLLGFLLVWQAAGPVARRWVLLLGSWLFYASFSPFFFLLLLASTGLDYQIGRALERTEAQPQRRALLAASLCGNLGLLVYFKYSAFLLSLVGLAPPPDPQVFHVEGSIPPGISFYTFQALSYTIDVYRRRSPACEKPVDFAIYVSFFPQLVAGPIVRSSGFLPQLKALPGATQQQAIRGAELFAVGLFKKVVIADNIGVLIDPVFADVGAHTGPTLAMAAVLFSAQVYCDFSGYSTMARGLAQLLGFSLPKNFDYPWLATSPLGFRRGWHLTMSHWFRDYVFHPLGGARGGPVRTAGNLLLVWGLFGLWHGAGWTFVVWGLYNGVAQIVHRSLARRVPIPDFPGKPVLGWLLTVSFLVPSCLFFRTPSVQDGLAALGRIATFQQDGAALLEPWWWLMAALILSHVASRRAYDEDLLSKLRWPGRIGLLCAITHVILAAAPEQRPFIYFQF